MSAATTPPPDLLELDHETPQSAGRLAKDRTATVAVWAAFVIAMVPLVGIIVALIVRIRNPDGWDKTVRVFSMPRGLAQVGRALEKLLALITIQCGHVSGQLLLIF